MHFRIEGSRTFSCTKHAASARDESSLRTSLPLFPQNTEYKLDNLAGQAVHVAMRRAHQRKTIRPQLKISSFSSLLSTTINSSRALEILQGEFAVGEFEGEPPTVCLSCLFSPFMEYGPYLTQVAQRRRSSAVRVDIARSKNIRHLQLSL